MLITENPAILPMTQYSLEVIGGELLAFCIDSVNPQIAKADGVTQ
jgi:hypothetical protein